MRRAAAYHAAPSRYAAAMSSDPAALESIRRLIALYGQLLDSGRLDDWGQLFTFDAVFRVWGETYAGREKILAGIGGMQPAAPGKHVILTPVIDLDDAEHARAWTDLTAFATTPDGISIATIGRYHDRIALDQGRWRFAQRVIVMAGEPLPSDVDPTPPA